MWTRCQLAPLLLATALLSLAAPATGQSPPDPKAVSLAEELKMRNASAPDAARELRAMRLDAESVASTLHAVGYPAPAIGQALDKEFRLDARSSAETVLRATKDRRAAFLAMSEAVRSGAEGARIAREVLRMEASEVVAAHRSAAAMATRKAYTDLAFADLRSAGYDTSEIVGALVDEAEETPTGIYEGMLVAGASLAEIAQELQSSAGQSVEQIVELFIEMDAPAEEAAAAIDAISGTTADKLMVLFMRLNLEDPNGDPETLQRAEIALGYVESGAAAVDALSGRLSGRALAVIAISLDVAKYGTALAASQAGAIGASVARLAERGVALAEAAGALKAFGASQRVIAKAAYFSLGTVDQTWGFLRNTLTWSANEVEAALVEVVPITISFLARMLELGAAPDTIKRIVAGLRNTGVSAVSIATEVGQEVGVVGMAQMLWNAGYDAGEVTAGLVQGMNATAAEAAAVVTGLVGGES